MSQHPDHRVMAVHLASRGFGYTVFESGPQMVEWGLKQTRQDKEQRTLAHFERLAQLYRPKYLLLADYASYPRRQTIRIRELTSTLANHAATLRIKVRLVHWNQVRASLRLLGVGTKAEMAKFIAARVPDLAVHLPPIRKPWMSEDHRMSLFEAAALVLHDIGWDLLDDQIVPK